MSEPNEDTPKEKPEEEVFWATPEDGEKIANSVAEKIDVAFVVNGDKVVSAKDYIGEGVESEAAQNETRDAIKKEVASKAMPDGSTQFEGLGAGVETMFSLAGDDVKVKDPPYDTIALMGYLQREETHSRCCHTKITDAIGRGYALNPREELLALGKPLDDGVKAQIGAERKLIKAFIRDANREIGFKGVLKKDGLDREGGGYAAIEVVRGKDFLIKKIAHIPAWRVRPLEGFRGFVEVVGNEKTYYQNWGDKVVVQDSSEPDGFRPWNPFDDKPDAKRWNYVDRKTGKKTNDFSSSANEIIWLVKEHPATVYYGLPDVIPAMGSVVGNIYIETYGLQFFENNAIPHYAIVVEGATLSDDVLRLIQAYFRKQIKGRSHSTLIIPVPSSGKTVKLRFEKLSEEQKEGSFQTYRKNNQQAIMTAHGVSPAILGIADAASLGSGKGRAQTENYRDRIIEPSQDYYETVLNDLFAKGLGVTLVQVEFDPYNIQDNLDLEIVLTGHQKEGNLSINEVRKIAKLGPPLPGGDKHYKVVGRALYCIEDGVLIADEKPTEPSSERIEGNLGTAEEEKFANVRKWTDEEIVNEFGVEFVQKSPPCRQSGETEQECVSRKIPEIRRERPDWTQDHVLGAAYGMCRRSCKGEGNELV